MPYGDGTGPNGMGPKTGREMGACAGMQPRFCCGRGFGRGRGFGWRATAMEPVELTPEQEQKILEQRERALESELQEIKKAKAKK